MLNAVLIRPRVGSDTAFELAIWIDQICINQENSEEKFYAIANLDVIYCNALEVRILLEDVNISHKEESAICVLRPKEHKYSLPDSFHLASFKVGQNMKHRVIKYREALKSIITKIFDSRWFTRAWCRHEYMLGSNPILMIIGRRLSSVTFSTSYIPDVLLGLDRNGVNIEYLFLHPAARDLILDACYQTTEQREGDPLFRTFVQLQRLSCLFQRDIISISLNVSGIRLNYNSDITHQRECRYILAMIALSAGDASVLGGEGSLMYRMDYYPSRQPILYWPEVCAADWSGLTYSSSSKVPNDARIWNITLERALLDAFVLLSRPVMPPREFKDNADELLSLLEINNGICTNIFRCAFAFGFEWIDMASRSLESLLVKRLGHHHFPYQVMSEITLLSYRITTSICTVSLCSSSFSPIAIDALTMWTK
jgi:Heterokaryon incompatibility protein (HET)